MNAMAKPGTGNPETDPQAQGGEGGDNAAARLNPEVPALAAMPGAAGTEVEAQRTGGMIVPR